jgi:hypothetical protein
MKPRHLCLASVVALLTSLSASSLAADKQKPEFGITLASLSATRTTNSYGDYYYGYSSSDTTVMFSAPGDAFFGLTAPGLHVAIPAGEKLCLEPQASLTFASTEGSTGLLLSPSLQVNVALRPWRSKTAYFFGRGGALISVGDGSDAQLMAGLGVGYRVPVRSVVVIRWEAYYNRFFDAHANQIGAHMKIGVIF